MQSNIPPELIEHIEEHFGTSDYALYVLDGQTAERPGDEDDWHDVIVIEDRGYRQPLIYKVVMDPEGGINHARLT